MKNKILHGIGILLLIFIAYEISAASIEHKYSGRLSTDEMVVHDEQTGTASMGFYAIDAVTRRPIQGVLMSIFLKNSDDVVELNMKPVRTLYTDNDGFVLFTDLAPTVSTSTDARENTSYVLIANDKILPPSCNDICQRYETNRLSDIGLSTPGHYDSDDIFLNPIRFYRTYADLNGDGLKDVLVSNGQENGRAGFTWGVGINKGNNRYATSSDLFLDFTAAAVGYDIYPGDTTKSLLTYLHGSAYDGLLISYRVEGSKIIERHMTIYTSEQADAPGKDVALYHRLLKDAWSDADSPIKIEEIPREEAIRMGMY